MDAPSFDHIGVRAFRPGSSDVNHRAPPERTSQIAMRPPCPVQTLSASAPASARSAHVFGVKLTIGVGAPALPRGPSGTATSVMSPETIACATTRVVPDGRHPLASGWKTCARSVVPGGNRRCVGEAVGAALVAAGIVTLGVGDEAASVATGAPDGEHAAITTATTAATALLTRESLDRRGVLYGMKSGASTSVIVASSLIST